MDDFVAEMRKINNKKVGDSLVEQKSIIERDYQALNYIEETHEDLLHEDDDTQHTLSQLTSTHSTHEEDNFPFQPQQNPRRIHEVEVQGRNSPNMHEEKSMMTLEDDEQTN